jgi:hypothetical protein
MRKLVSSCIALCAMLFVFTGPVWAQSVLWVANNGSDANTCTQTSPCATFAGVISKGSVSRINCLTSGNYGIAVITTSITIDCGTGNIGEIVLGSGNTFGIQINAGGAAVTVVLRHLSIDGRNASGTAIGITSSNANGVLIIEDCTVQGFHNGSGKGISFIATGSRALLNVSRSQIFDNVDGLFVSGLNQIATVILDHVELLANSSNGLWIGSGTIAGTMRNSIVAGNTANGVLASSTTNQVFFTIEESSVIANLTSGINTNSGSIFNVGSSTIGANGVGVQANQGAFVTSFGNNQMSANGSNGNFTGTTPLQ